MALREINLVPEDILARRHLWRHLSFWGMTLGFALALIFGVHVYQRHSELAARQRPGNLEGLKTAMTLKSEKIKALQADMEHLKRKRDAIRLIVGNLPYTGILASLAGILNGATWFTHLSLERDRNLPGAASLKIQGSSFHNKELGNFLNLLSGEGLFQNVSLKYARESELATSAQNRAASVEVTHFQIECQVTRNSGNSKRPRAAGSRTSGAG